MRGGVYAGAPFMETTYSGFLQYASLLGVEELGAD